MALSSYLSIRKMEFEIHSHSGVPTGRTVEVDDAAFEAEPNDHVLWLDVRRTQASARQGTHKTKERSEVRGSTRKLYRQKGTGRARSGSISSPLRRSGGRTFGPRPRSYVVRLSRKVRRLARRSALTYLVRRGGVCVVEQLNFDEPSTQDLLGIIDAFELTGKRTLVVTAAHSASVYRSSCNIQKVVVKEVRNLTAEDILRARTLLCEEEAVLALTGTSMTEAAVETE